MFLDAGVHQERPGRHCVLVAACGSGWRRGAVDALRRRGFVVDTADDLDRALGALARKRFDAVVLDLPETDVSRDSAGTAAQAIGSIADATGLGVALLTIVGDDGDEVAAAAFDAGATDIVLRGERHAALAMRVVRLVELESARLECDELRTDLARSQAIGHVGSIEWRSEERLVRASTEAFRMLGLRPTLSGLSLARLDGLLARDERRRLRREFVRALRTGDPIGIDLRMRTHSGAHRLLRLDGAVEDVACRDVRASARRCVRVRGMLRDLTRSRVAEAKALRLARHDPVTGLVNARGFVDACAQAIDAARPLARPVAVITLDLDRFKQINASLGFLVGDDVLREVGRRLQIPPPPAPEEPDLAHARVRAAARFGGDDFGVLVEGLREPAQAERFASRMLDALYAPTAAGDTDLFIATSAGVAVYPRDGADPAALLTAAGAALSAAKARGGGVAEVYRPSLRAFDGARLRLESALHRALERGELELHYQVQVDGLGQPRSAEALIRWRNGDRLVPPAEFVPIAEENGLIIPIGEWAIRTACGQLRAWHDAGLALRSVAVNVPPRHFERPSLLSTVRDAMAASGLAAGALELEITETGLMSEVDRAIDRMRELRAAGAQLSIDDFGTGYSSLAYLTQLPVSTLKIDRAFVRGVGGERGDTRAVVRAIVALARTLDLATVAEGVETPDQRDALVDLGCDLLQGYLFSRPVPPDEVPAACARLGAAEAG